jgi:hypothetical protein
MIAAPALTCPALIVDYLDSRWRSFGGASML